MKSASITGFLGLALLAPLETAAAEAVKGPFAVEARGRFALADVDDADLSIPGLAIEIDSTVGGEAAFSYAPIDYVAVEMGLAVSRHRAHTTGVADVDLEAFGLVQPYLLAQLRLPLEDVLPDTPLDGLTLTVGGGVHYTRFATLGDDRIDYSDDVGPLFQVGVEQRLSSRWSAVIEYKRFFLDTEVATTSPTLDGTLKGDVSAIGFGLNYAFGFGSDAS